jgi:hypothetical protein
MACGLPVPSSVFDYTKLPPMIDVMPKSKVTPAPHVRQGRRRMRLKPSEPSTLTRRTGGL